LIRVPLRAAAKRRQIAQLNNLVVHEQGGNAMPRSCRRLSVMLAAVCAAAFAGSVRAESVADFYKDKQLKIVVGADAGSDYDLGSRLLAKYMTRYIPGNPAIIIQNMTGAGGIRAANYVYNAAPKDGTVIADFSRNIPSQAALGQKNVRVDPRRLAWIGATSLPNRICAVLGSSPIKSVDQLYTTQLLVGSTGVGSAYSIVPTMINRTLGTKIKPVEGYKGLADVLVAMERGEVGGVCLTMNQFESVYADKVEKGAVRILFSIEEEPLTWPAGTPTIFSRLKTEADRQLFRFVFDATGVFGRPYAFGPGVPKERTEAVRKAFLEAMKDKDLLADAKKLKLDMRYRSAEQLEAYVRKIYDTPPAVMKKAAAILVR
jgi:tripartite-type tricarboxylate transporter receptor subunit TctC